MEVYTFKEEMLYWYMEESKSKLVIDKRMVKFYTQLINPRSILAHKSILAHIFVIQTHHCVPLLLVKIYSLETHKSNTQSLSYVNFPV